MNDRLGTGSPSVSFSVKPHALESFSFPVQLSDGITAYRIRAIARAGTLVDAEERELPVLPSRERLLSSEVVYLDGTMKKRIPGPRLAEGDRIERSTLQIDPQLALPILNSIPFLVRYPYECTEQVLNRYVPLAIVSQVFAKYPALAEAAKKVPRRDTITPEWDRSDPRRAMQLMETPWEGISKGAQSHYPVIDLLAPEIVTRERKEALSRLKSYQLGSGAFPWFPGGRDDAYMTLYVLSGFAEARGFGVEIPEEVAQQAFQYVLRELPARLKPAEADLALVLFGAYVLGSYIDDYPWAKAASPLIQAWVDFADKHSRALTPMGKAYAAHVYRKLGNQAKSDHYLTRAMDGSRKDEVTGVYWTPEKISWLWYTDTVEKHAFFLKTLLQLKPGDNRIPGLAQWLLFNRKGTEWKSTRASAAAIYSLLDFMKKRGALDRGDSFAVAWAGTSETIKIEPTDWLSRPLRWSKTNLRAGQDLAAAVDKKGPGIAFASLTTLFTSQELQKTGAGQLITVDRKLFRRVKDGSAYRLVPLSAEATVAVGDQVEVHLNLTSRSQFEYVHVKAPKGAGFEAEELTSGWRWDQLSRYQEPRDSLTNFFVAWLPHGEYVLKYRLRATTPGTFRFGSAVVQSMYAPEMTAYSSGAVLSVKE